MEAMDIEYFKDMGYLQEVNREFFHPLGLALGVKDGKLIVVIANDEIGWYFDVEDEKDFNAKAHNIKERRNTIAKKRLNALGFAVQPVYSVLH